MDKYLQLQLLNYYVLFTALVYTVTKWSALLPCLRVRSLIPATALCTQFPCLHVLHALGISSPSPSPDIY